jgi:hypothetical protein
MRREVDIEIVDGRLEQEMDLRALAKDVRFVIQNRNV